MKNRIDHLRGKAFSQHVHFALLVNWFEMPFPAYSVRQRSLGQSPGVARMEAGTAEVTVVVVDPKESDQCA
jgi:hypothetical protein